MEKMTGRTFGQTVCKHFGLNPKKVGADLKIKTDLDDVVTIELTIFPTPDDIKGIGDQAAQINLGASDA